MQEASWTLLCWTICDNIWILACSGALWTNVWWKRLEIHGNETINPRVASIIFSLEMVCMYAICLVTHGISAKYGYIVIIIDQNYNIIAATLMLHSFHCFFALFSDCFSLLSFCFMMYCHYCYYRSKKDKNQVIYDVSVATSDQCRLQRLCLTCVCE